MEQSVDAALKAAVLASERRRVKMIAGALTIGLAVFVVVTTANPDLVPRLFHGAVRRRNVALGMLALIAIESAVAVGLGRMIERGEDLPPFVRFGSIVLECSVITAVLLFEFRLFPPVVTLTVPTVFGYFLLIVLSTLRLDFWQSAFCGLTCGLSYLGLALYALSQPAPPDLPPIMSEVVPHVGKAGLLTFAGLLAGVVGAEIRRQIKTVFEMQAERQRVVDVFGRHVSPAVVNKLLEQSAELTSEVRHVCVMFLDIRNFTTFSEHRTPAEVVAFLNQLFGFMIEEVNRHQGIVNKFLGDGFMAVFGAPITDGRDCRNAVEAARAILTRLDAMVQAGTVPPTRVGVGLHAGEAVTGTVGSPQRKEYTVIGDVVNLASRIESLNKELGSQVLVSAAVWEQVKADGVPGTPRGPMKVKGREEAVEIYQVV